MVQVCWQAVHGLGRSPRSMPFNTHLQAHRVRSGVFALCRYVVEAPRRRHVPSRVAPARSAGTRLWVYDFLIGSSASGCCATSHPSAVDRLLSSTGMSRQTICSTSAHDDRHIHICPSLSPSNGGASSVCLILPSIGTTREATCLHLVAYNSSTGEIPSPLAA